MQFQVPQFIEVEDKIFGPLTFKQFIYLGGGIGAGYIMWRILPIYIAGPIILVVGGLAAALAFFQFNGRPFIQAIENGFYYLIKSKLYLWNNASKPSGAQTTAAAMPSTEQLYIPKLSESRLHELAWSLDIKERIASGVADERERRMGPPEDVMAPIRTAREALRSSPATAAGQAMGASEARIR